MKKEQSNSSAVKEHSTSKVTRFRISKRSGMNLRMHPNQQNRINSTLGMSNSGFQPVRLNDIGPMEVILRSCLKDLYSIGTSRRARSTIVRPNTRWKTKNLDRYVIVLLHRSGLVNSINQARQLVTHGHIFLKKGDTSNVITRPTYVVAVGDIIYIDNVVWNNLVKSNVVQWSKWKIDSVIKSNTAEEVYNVNRRIPPYVEVDYNNGSMILVNECNDENVLLPAGLGKRAKVRIWGKD